MNDITIRYSYKNAPTVKAFSKSNKFIRGLMGPFGSGKSVGCVVEIIKRAQQQQPGQDGIRRTRWAVIRNTYQQLKDTSIKTFHEWLPAGIFGTYNKTDHNYTITAFENCHIEIMFRALDRPDQVNNLLSLELTGAWVNEAREVPWTVIQALQGRVGRYPSKVDVGCTWWGMFMDTNPPDEDSWWYKLFEERRPRNAEIFKQPSGLSDQAENVPNLPENYYDNMVDSLDDETKKVYVDGVYGFTRDGKPVYPEYNDTIHCKPCSPIDGIPIHRGWDFGLTPSCIFTQVLPSGVWIIFDEMVADNMAIDEFADDVIVHTGQHYGGFEFIDTGDPAGNKRSETDKKTCFQILKAKGIHIQPGEQTLQIRLESVKKPLRTLKGGQAGLLVDPKCRMIRKGFMGRYRYKRMMVTEDKYHDSPDKNEYSHPHDALQYTATKLFTTGLTKSKKKRKKIPYNRKIVV